VPARNNHRHLIATRAFALITRLSQEQNIHLRDIAAMKTVTDAANGTDRPHRQPVVA